MTTMLVCTGKKKAVEKIADFFKELERKQKISIIASCSKSKKAMIWNYEELKLLFDSVGLRKIEIDRKLTRAVDFIQFRMPRGLVVKMSTFKVESKDLRWNIISRTTTFQLRGGRIDIREEIDDSGRKEFRTCHMTLAGPPSQVIQLKELLVKERVADPKSVEFIL